MFRTRIFGLGLIAVAFALMSVSVPGQAPKTVNAGVLNGKALDLPIPKYPPGALKAGVSGIIAVEVVIDESGNVVSAVADVNDQRERRDVDGTKLDLLPADPALRAYAEAAALTAKFSPTLIKGAPGKVSGRILYNFFADDEQGSTRVVESGSIPAPNPAGAASVLNGRALSLPRPEYPAAAKAVRAEGAVSVRVMIDEQGNVISAAAVSGHPLLRAAAEAAARLATFSPSVLAGTAVRVSGSLTYNFVLPKVEDK